MPYGRMGAKDFKEFVAELEEMAHYRPILKEHQVNGKPALDFMHALCNTLAGHLKPNREFSHSGITQEQFMDILQSALDQNAEIGATVTAADQYGVIRLIADTFKIACLDMRNPQEWNSEIRETASNDLDEMGIVPGSTADPDEIDQGASALASTLVLWAHAKRSRKSSVPTKNSMFYDAVATNTLVLLERLLKRPILDAMPNLLPEHLKDKGITEKQFHREIDQMFANAIAEAQESILTDKAREYGLPAALVNDILALERKKDGPGRN